MQIFAEEIFSLWVKTSEKSGGKGDSLRWETDGESTNTHTKVHTEN